MIVVKLFPVEKVFHVIIGVERELVFDVYGEVN